MKILKRRLRIGESWEKSSAEVQNFVQKGRKGLKK
jgi:hypothetical protein